MPRDRIIARYWNSVPCCGTVSPYRPISSMPARPASQPATGMERRWRQGSAGRGAVPAAGTREPDHRDGRTRRRRADALRAHPRARPSGSPRSRTASDCPRRPSTAILARAQPRLRAGGHEHAALLAGRCRVRARPDLPGADRRPSAAAPSRLAVAADAGDRRRLSVLVGDGRIYVDQVTPPREIVMSVSLGHRFPLHAGSSSKALLAFLPDDEVERYLGGGLEPLTESTRTDPDALRVDLANVTQQGIRHQRRRTAGGRHVRGLPGVRPWRASGRQHQRVRPGGAPRR